MQCVSVKRLQTFSLGRVNLNDGKSHSNVWSEMLSQSGSDDAKHKKNRTQIRGEICLLYVAQHETKEKEHSRNKNRH